jgi:geranylgeranyl pyrophosphate synthase
MNMNSKPELMENFKGIIEERGKDALEEARKEILGLQYNGGPVSSALEYFAKVTLRGALPVFPALTSLSCEAVGGKTEKTTSIAAALTLIAGAADVHDDIIDQSPTKYSKKTVLGKFGRDVALLAGDALLMQGLMLLHKECESLSREQGKAIQNLVLEAFFEISKAEAMETRLMKRFDTPPQEYFEVLKSKAVVPELYCKIGAIMGNGDADAVEILGHYGRTFGIISLIREEFIDLSEYAELQNRLKNECPPLPMLYALQNPKTKKEIILLLENKKLIKKSTLTMVETILATKEAQELKGKMDLMIKEETENLKCLKNSNITSELTLLITAIKEEL